MQKGIKRIIATLLFLVSTNTVFSDVKVYICDSETSVAYHSKEACRGLQKCKHKIILVSKSQAIKDYKKRACKLCY